MSEFQLSDVTGTIDQETRNLIAELVLAWARYDSLVTQWTFRTFGMGPDEGAIIVGNMDTRTKLERIKTLYKHLGADKAAAKVAALAKEHKEHVDVRNSVCHKSCAGHSRSDPDRIIFANAKTYPQKPGQMFVELIHISQFRAAIEFANRSSGAIVQLVESLIELRKQPSEPSPDNPPTSPPDPQHA